MTLATEVQHKLTNEDGDGLLDPLRVEPLNMDIRVYTEADPRVPDSEEAANVVEIFTPDVLPTLGFGNEVLEYLVTIAVQVRCRDVGNRNRLLSLVDQLACADPCKPIMASSVEIISSTTGYDDTENPETGRPHGGISTFNYRTGTDPREE